MLAESDAHVFHLCNIRTWNLEGKTVKSICRAQSEAFMWYLHDPRDHLSQMNLGETPAVFPFNPFLFGRRYIPVIPKTGQETQWRFMKEIMHICDSLKRCSIQLAWPKQHSAIEHPPSTWHPPSSTYECCNHVYHVSSCLPQTFSTPSGQHDRKRILKPPLHRSELASSLSVSWFDMSPEITQAWVSVLPTDSLLNVLEMWSWLGHLSPIHDRRSASKHQ